MKKYKVRVVEDVQKKYNVNVEADGVSYDVETGFLMFFREGTNVAMFSTWVYFKEMGGATQDS